MLPVQNQIHPPVRVQNPCAAPLTPAEVEIISQCTFCDQRRFADKVQKRELNKHVREVTALVTAVFSAPHLDLRVNYQDVPVTVTCVADRIDGLRVTLAERG